MKNSYDKILKKKKNSKKLFNLSFNFVGNFFK